jgi:osmotically-inducible protein OsmY
MGAGLMSMRVLYTAGVRGALPLVILLAACASSPPRSAPEAQADTVTAERIYTALREDPKFYFQHVDVSVVDGVAHLSGQVWTADALFQAQKIARAIPGVVRVENAMELVRPGVRGGSG